MVYLLFLFDNDRIQIIIILILVDVITVHAYFLDVQKIFDIDTLDIKVLFEEILSALISTNIFFKTSTDIISQIPLSVIYTSFCFTWYLILRNLILFVLFLLKTCIMAILLCETFLWLEWDWKLPYFPYAKILQMIRRIL